MGLSELVSPGSFGEKGNDSNKYVRVVGRKHTSR